MFVTMVLRLIREARAAAAKTIDWFKRLGSWVPALMNWAWDGRRFWLPIFAPIILWVLVSSFIKCCEQQVRLTGMLLQLLGVVTVALRLRAAQRQFPWQAVTEWLKRRPRFGVTHQILSAGTVSIGVGTMRARMRVGAGPLSSLEDRIGVLEKNYANLFDEVGALDQELTQKTAELSTNLKIESTTRVESDKKLEEKLKEAVVGVLHLDLWGVLYFVLGIIAGTASSEIASFFGAAPCK
jgi:hypothetical protein